MMDESLPIYSLTDESGRSLCLVLTIGTFAQTTAGGIERALPVVHDALNAAQELRGEDCLYTYYAKPAEPDAFVRNVRHAITRTLGAGRSALWLRTDTEQDMRAALAIARSDYTTTAITHGRETNQANQ